MISNKEISLAIIEACKASQELNDFIQGKFNKPITYIRGLNLERTEWDENEFEYVPSILIDTISYESGDSDDRVISTLELQTKIKHDDEYWGLSPVDNVITYTGIDEIEEFNRLIIEAIKQHDSLKCYQFEDVLSYIEPVRFISNSTEYNGFIRLHLEEEVNIGCG